jgi:predicted ribosome quality control (RQC) complex YloA/Tae2 family protein
MKDSMTGFDVRAVSLELDAWSGAYVKKAYMPHYEQIVLRINPKESEQFDLVIVRGQRVYTSKRDRPMPMTPPSFAMVLRKHLKNARLTMVEQVGFDRVLMFRFDTKHGQRSLSVELFRNGNVILMDENDVIIQPLTHASYSGRTIKKGEIYVPPPAAIDPYNLTLESLKEAFDESDRDLVSTLGGKINLGGIYANAVCEHAGLEPNSSTDDADVSVVLDSLKHFLEKLNASRTGHLILKPTKEHDENTLDALLAMDALDAKATTTLREAAVEATPLLLPSHSNARSYECASLCSAIDAWKGHHDANALARREQEKLDAAAPGRGHSTEVEKLERRLKQQEQALEGFAKKIEKQQAIGHAIQEHWTHVETILQQAREAVEKQGWKPVLKGLKENPWVDSGNAAERTMMVRLPDDDGQPGQAFTLHLDDSVHQNAQRYFEAARKQKDKTAGATAALEDTKVAFKRAQKKEAKQKASGRMQTVRRSKRLWFEQHRWSMISGGHLLVGGRDAKGNDSIVKKHLSGGDMYLHADIHGAPSCSLRASQGFALVDEPYGQLPPGVPSYKLVDKLGDERINDEKLEEAATLALCWSRAWNGGGAHGTVFAVKPAQVSKSAQTGEYVGKGAFIVRGQRQWFKDMDVQMGIGLVAINGVPLLMGGTVSSIKERCQRYAILSPGQSKKEQLANRIYKATGLRTDDVLSVLPGSSDILEDVGVFSPFQSQEEE